MPPHPFRPLCVPIALALICPAVSPAALVSQYTFDSITRVFTSEDHSDYSDYVNDGATAGGNHQLLVSGIPEFVPGVVGSALYLNDPPSAFITSNAADNAGFMTQVPAISLIGWVNPASLPPPRVDVGIISMLSVESMPFNSRFVMAINSAGQVEVGGRAIDSAPYQSRFTQAALTLNQWVCVAAVIDYRNDFIEIYLDGVKQTLQPGTTSFFSSLSTNTAGAFFGLGAGPGRSEFFHGALDEMSFYDEALSPDQIRELSRIPEPSNLSLIGLVALALRGPSRKRSKLPVPP